MPLPSQSTDAEQQRSAYTLRDPVMTLLHPFESKEMSQPVFLESKFFDLDCLKEQGKEGKSPTKTGLSK